MDDLLPEYEQNLFEEYEKMTKDQLITLLLEHDRLIDNIMQLLTKTGELAVQLKD